MFIRTEEGPCPGVLPFRVAITTQKQLERTRSCGAAGTARPREAGSKALSRVQSREQRDKTRGTCDDDTVASGTVVSTCRGSVGHVSILTVYARGLYVGT